MRERVLVVVNKAADSRAVELGTDDTALAGCTAFEPLAPTQGAVPRLDAGKMRIEEAGETMSLYLVR
jgi:hypothetical protein